MVADDFFRARLGQMIEPAGVDVKLVGFRVALRNDVFLIGAAESKIGLNVGQIRHGALLGCGAATGARDERQGRNQPEEHKTRHASGVLSGASRRICRVGHERPGAFGELVRRPTLEFLEQRTFDRDEHRGQGFAGCEASPVAPEGVRCAALPEAGLRAATTARQRCAERNDRRGCERLSRLRFRFLLGFSGRPVSGSRFLVRTISRMRSSLGKGGGTPKMQPLFASRRLARCPSLLR